MEHPHATSAGSQAEPGNTAELLADLNRKVDLLTQQVTFLTRRQLAWDELKHDMAPVVNDLYQMAVEELAQVDREFTIDNLLYLLRKLLRNTNTLTGLLDQVTSMADLVEDVLPLSKQMHYAAIERLDELERRGAFAFTRELGRIGERVMDSFTPEDVERLGDNIVHILNTLKSATQPDLLDLVNDTLDVIRQGHPIRPMGLVGLLKATREPDVRLGLGVVMEILRVIAKTMRDSPKTNQLAKPQRKLLQES